MRQSKIYVGNLSYDISEDELQQHFSQYGNIEETKLIIDRGTGRSKGFAFITYENQQDAQAAVDGADQTSLGGRQMKVSIAREENRSAGSKGGRGRSYNE